MSGNVLAGWDQKETKTAHYAQRFKRREPDMFLFHLRTQVKTIRGAHVDEYQSQGIREHSSQPALISRSHLVVPVSNVKTRLSLETCSRPSACKIYMRRAGKCGTNLSCDSRHLNSKRKVRQIVLNQALETNSFLAHSVLHTKTTP